MSKSGYEKMQGEINIKTKGDDSLSVKFTEWTSAQKAVIRTEAIRQVIGISTPLSLFPSQYNK